MTNGSPSQEMRTTKMGQKSGTAASGNLMTAGYEKDQAMEWTRISTATPCPCFESVSAADALRVRGKAALIRITSAKKKDN